MSTEITWLGHGTWLIESAGKTIILDPFLDDSPTAPLKAADVNVDEILVTHGHFDHVGDVAKIAEASSAEVIGAVEVCQWLEKQGVKKTLAMNLGGMVERPYGRVKMTLALHSSSMPDGSYGGTPAGFVVDFAEGRVYFAGDTAPFLDMKLIGAGGLELAVLPIGDLFTMGPEDSIEAIKLLEPRRVVPGHFGTWPPIQQDPNAWAERVRTHTRAEPVVLRPGEKLSL